jgi:PIN domain nuclease of toxin-antitoxin system
VTPARRSRRKTGVRVAETPPAYVARQFLLDTHVLLWWHTEPKRLGPVARAAISASRGVTVSVATAWEIAIKTSLGKLKIPGDATMDALLTLAGFQPLAIELAHVAMVRTLPPVHRDPFDRLLVAQAMAEGLTIITSDRHLQRYDVPILAATQ